MIDDSTTQCLLFPGIFSKPVVAQFDQRQGSSDGGAILLKAADRRYGLLACLASCLQDERQPGKIDHSLEELLAQRVFAIACGYPDANDAARLAVIPFTSCYSTVTPSRAPIWRRSPRCRGLKMPSGPRNFIASVRLWPPA